MVGKLRALSFGKLIGFGLIGIFVLAGIAGATAPDQTTPTEAPVQVTDTENSQQVESESIETKIVKTTLALPYKTTNQNDPTIEVGKSKISVAGVKGEQIIYYEVTLTNGAESARKEISSETTKPPIDEVIKVGTKKATAPKPAASSNSNCDPNYSGACVPIASDVDCAGGSGNGPAYVNGPVTIVGIDIYGLDGNDNDGIGCE